MLEWQFSIINHKPALSKAVFFFKSQTCSWGHKVTTITQLFYDFIFHNAPGRPAAGVTILFTFFNRLLVNVLFCHRGPNKLYQ